MIPIGLAALKPACSICAPEGASWLDVIKALAEEVVA